MLDTFCVISPFVAPIGATVGILLGILTTLKGFMVMLVGGVSELLNLFPEFLRGVQKQTVFCPKALPMEAYTRVADLDKQVRILMLMKLDFPHVFSEFHLWKSPGETLLQCLPK